MLAFDWVDFETGLQLLVGVVVGALIIRPDGWVFGALVVLALLVAGKEGLRALETRRGIPDYQDDIKTLQNKVASLSVAVGLSGRK